MGETDVVDFSSTFELEICNPIGNKYQAELVKINAKIAKIEPIGTIFFFQP